MLHRYFADFDDFLAALVLDRAAWQEVASAALMGAAGTGSVTGNLAEALRSLLSPVAVGVVALITFRDELRARLRETWPTGLPLLAEAGRTILAYLEAERAAGRVAAEADTRSLALSLVGSGHLLFADRTGQPPAPEAVRALVEGILEAVTR